MSATADPVAISTASPEPRPTTTRIPVWISVIGSRLLILAAGTVGAASFPKVPGWQYYDPGGITLSMGRVGNLLGAASVRGDAITYINLAQHGYTSARSTAYFPLYPLLIHALTPPGGSPILAGILISLTSFAIGLELVHRITRWEVGQRAADVTVLLLAFSPFSFVFSAVYTGSLLLACIAGTFYLARQDRFVLACLVAAGGALVHIQGILLVAPLAVMYWKSRGSPHALRTLWSWSLPALALPIVTLGAWFTYLHSQGWGWLAPITNQNAANMGRSLVGPPIVLIRTIQDMVIELNQQLHGTGPPRWGVLVPSAQNAFYLGVLALAVCGLISVWRRMPVQYALFGALAILVSTSSAVAVEPLQGFDRYMLPIFPLWIGVAALIADRRLMPFVMTASSAMLVVYTIEFTRWVAVF